jgi:cell division septal protein FtsQ
VSASAVPPAENAIVVEHPPPRRRFLRRRNNRRVAIMRPSVATLVEAPLRAIGRRLVTAGKLLAVIAFVAASAQGGRLIVRRVIASPRFAVRDITIGPTDHVSAEEVAEVAGVRPGDQLLSIDPDAVAARLTTHPWILAARVRRDLPSTLSIEVTERRAVATALLGALYLLDENGRPFKHATFAEADGLPVITGVNRDQYGAARSTSEAVFRQALALMSIYQGTLGGFPDPPATTPLGKAQLRQRGDAEDHPQRPKLSEVHVDPRAGFSLVLLDGSADIRLGRGDFPAKLARLDGIFAALGPRGPGALSVVYLDGPLSDRVALRLTPRKTAQD